MRHLIVGLLLFSSQAAWAGREAHDATVPLTNAEAALSSLTANPPLPMTFFKKGDYKLTTMMSVFSIRSPAVPKTTLADISLDGNITGFGAGVLYDKAISDDWSVFGTALGVRLGAAKMIGNAEDELTNSDTLFQSSESDSSMSVSATIGLNRRIYGNDKDGFLLSGFFGPTMFYSKGSGKVHVLNNKTGQNSSVCHQISQARSKDPAFNCVRRSYDITLIDGGFVAGLQGSVPIGKSFALNPYLFFLPGTYLFGSGKNAKADLDQPLTFTTEGGRVTTSEIGMTRGISFISLGTNLKYRPWSLSANLTSSFITPLLSSAAGIENYSAIKLQISKSFGTFKHKGASVDISR